MPKFPAEFCFSDGFHAPVKRHYTGRKRENLRDSLQRHNGSCKEKGKITYRIYQGVCFFIEQTYAADYAAHASYPYQKEQDRQE